MPSRVISGPAIPFERANVDTDLIIPARFMKTLGRDGLGEGAFDALRGEPNNPFDDPRYAGAPILVSGPNFGCGSSREHAVWALQQLGIEAVIAPSFGEIFEGNALRNGLVPVRLTEQEVGKLLRVGHDRPVTIDVEAGTVSAPGERVMIFSLDPYRRHCLVTGVDDVDLVLSYDGDLSAFEAAARRDRPWEQEVKGDPADEF